ncbi:MAG: hypothetical protein QXF97_06545 [Candidatus Caldarchaeum sp.]
METKTFETLIIIQPEVVKDSTEDDKFIGFFEGIASTPDIDLEGDRFTPEVLTKNAEKLVGKPVMLVHGKAELGPTPVGEILAAKFENGLKIKAGIYKAFEKIWQAVKNGVLRALSIGGIATKVRKENNGLIIEDAEIREVSLTPRGINPFARILHFFGKSFEVSEDGFLVECAALDLPIVRRETWDADAAKQRIFSWAEKEDGSIDRSKAGKLFLVVEGDGSKRGDYGWPVGDIMDGEPKLVSSAIITAIKFASRSDLADAAKVRPLLSRLAKRLVKEGILSEDYVLPWERSLADLWERIEMLEKTIVAKSTETNPQPAPQPTQEVQAAEKGVAAAKEPVAKQPSSNELYSPSLERILKRYYNV